ncbi:hypothetical protein PISL3812_02974 [Talaromyces islandicus]|uniref:Uncharacterized protein n=1 Tax=Talaromyces islandicus TaxID=28573 RepID=A0A0U1LTP1_TALIS|nr:hypothetical protein PISL3812_02974 [Talaromyces islandicus]
MKLKHAPPNFRVSLPGHIITHISPSKLVLSTDLAHAPEFIYKISPVGQTSDSPTPMAGAPQDLVFSIVYESAAQDFRTEYLEIRIKMKPPKQPFSHYTGPGPTMLSNLRFNALARPSSNREYMVLTLKPRSINGYVAAKKLKELSFLLSTVLVSTFNNETEIIADAYEKYIDQDIYHYEIPCKLKPVKKET